MTQQGEFVVGGSPVRLEDARFTRGQGRYLDDLHPPNAAHAVVVRSAHAHAKIRGIDVRAVWESEGVLAVLTGAELDAHGLGPLWPTAPANMQTGEPFAFEPQPLLAIDAVRHVGEAVALVVADSRAQAEEAALCIDVDYAPLPALVTVHDALAPDAIGISDAVPGNRCLAWQFGDRHGTEAAFDDAAHVVELTCHNHRVITNPMEPRSCLAHYDAGSERYTVEASTQNVHVLRGLIAKALGVAHDLVRLRAPDVGGGFGVRNFVYPEYVLAAWAARRIGRPVYWLNTRSEGFVSDHQARDFLATAKLALSEDGRFLGLHVASQANVGAFMVGASCGVQTGQYTTLPGSVYDIPAIHLDIGAVLTNTVPIGVTRGPGFAEAVDVLERLIDKAARVTGLDRFALRRLNLVPTSAMPWTNAVRSRVDSGDFLACFEMAQRRADVAGFAARRERSAARGRCRGLGLACHIKATGGLPEENVALHFDAERVSFTTGTMAIGQGHETSFRQILGTLLGLAPEQIEYVAGDTAAIAMGGGHGSSRATYMASMATARAVDAVAAKGRVLLAELMQAEASAIAFEGGWFRIEGSNQAWSVLEVARLAREAGQSLNVYQHITREAMTYPSGCHVAEVEVDPETGVVSIDRYTAVDDYGVQVNPMLVAGQMHGAIAQGVGQALSEAAVYEPADGQLLSGSFMDYALPRADDLPSFDVDTQGTPCTTNPLGVKGCGEAGAIAGFPAVANAVVDALAPLGVSQLDGPATPYRIWQLLHEQH